MNDFFESISRLSHKRLVLLANDLNTMLEQAKQQQSESVAVIGIGCRFPGGGDDPDSYWRMLRDGIDAITEVPPDRWNIADYFDPDPDAEGKIYSRWGGFIRNVDQFDPLFFEISPKEANSMDPQQRLLLEVSWEALENAGQSAAALMNSSTGVFMGISGGDYSNLTSRRLKVGELYSGTGNAFSIASGRISYSLGLRGPCMSIDTACSSSLVATHLAIQSLRLGECDMALAGGVNLILVPEPTIIFCKGRMLSFGGHCQTFDAAADGYVRGEGCGVVVLKRLSDALTDGDHILAVIRGSAVNQDGRSSGLTAPNGVAQEAVLRSALKDAGLKASEVDYIEAHGTGTELGDPIEMRAVSAVFGAGRNQEDPLLVGAVKTNIGHLEAAAGIASLIKVVLAFQHGEIPAHLHFTNPSPHIAWDEIPIRVPTQATPWPAGVERPIAGVSSFGFSGTNAHVILQAPPLEQWEESEVERPLHVLALSARSEAALKELAGRYEGHLTSEPEQKAGDVCFTAAAGRSHFQHRLAVVGEDLGQLGEKLAAFVRGEDAAGIFYGQAPEGGRRPKIVFLFTGQGSQYVGMGRELYETQPTFRRVLDECDKLLEPYLQQSLVSVLYPGSGGELEAGERLDQTDVTQPALFALEYAVAQLWRSWGVEPSAVMGHSVGEYTAACVAGVFSLQDGLKLIAERARLMGALPSGGVMAAVFADEGRVAAALAPYRNTVSIAAVNGPESVVISGAGDDVQGILKQLEAEEIKFTYLNVSHAFHSPLMEPVLAEFERRVKGVTFSKPRIKLISNLSGEVLGADEIRRPGRWLEHVREPVRFAESIKTLHEQGCRLYLEIGPHPTLLGMAARCLPEGAGEWLPSLRRGRSDWRQMLESLGALYVQGAPIDWQGFDRDYARRKVLLPTYPFQRKRYWISERSRGRKAAAGDEAGLHPLLCMRVRSPLVEDSVFTSTITADTVPFLKDHVVFGMVVFPATGYLEMALAAARLAFDDRAYTLEDVSIEAPLVLQDAQARELQLILSPPAEDATTFKIYSLGRNESSENGAWTLHASGTIRLSQEEADIPSLGATGLDELRQRCAAELDAELYYRNLRERGIEYGETFRTVEGLWHGDGAGLGRLGLSDALLAEAGDYQIHPALLDGCLQVLGANLSGGRSREERDDIYLPVGIGRLRVYSALGHSCWSYARVHEGASGGRETIAADIQVFDDEGRMVAQVEGLTVKRADREALRRVGHRRLQEWLYEIQWQAKEREPIEVGSGTGSAEGQWLVFADRSGAADELIHRLRQRGEACIPVYEGEDYEILKEGGYRLNPLKPDDFGRLFDDVLAGSQPVVKGVVHLWSLDCDADLDGIDSLESAQALSCGSVLHLVQALGRGSLAPAFRLWLVTRGSQSLEDAAFRAPNAGQAPLWGLGRVVAVEHPEFCCRQIDLDPADTGDGPGPLIEELFGESREDQVAFRDKARYVARLVRHTLRSRSAGKQLLLPRGESYQLVVTQPGVLDNLEFNSVERRAPGAGEVEIRVHMTGLNFRDVLNALGMYPGDAGPPGGECVGRITAVGEGAERFKIGDEVLAIAGGSFSKYVLAPADWVVAKPQGLSDEQAATIPIAFLTAYYGLCRLAGLKQGERVLIHAAAGGVGMAAVQLAHWVGAEVFGTAGSPEKRAYLKSLGVDQVMNSRTLEFADEIMEITGGRGVDVVLNALAGEFIPKSLSVLAPGGRFIEIGKAEIWDDRKVAAVKPGVSYTAFDLGEVILQDSQLVGKMFAHLLKGFQEGRLKALPFRVFPIEESAGAFRFMAQARHIGKIVVSQRHMLEAEESADRKKFSSEAGYLITGGLGGLGLQVAGWMIEQGARRLVLVGRSGPSAEALKMIAALEDKGAAVTVAQGDVSEPSDMERIFSGIESSGVALRGIIHAAGVLDDGVLMQQKWSRFVKVLAPKVRGAWLLHRRSRDLALDFFILFSSVSSVLGSAGQGNYAAASAFMDALAHYRRAQGLPGLSINWGAWDKIGMADRTIGADLRALDEMGFGLIAPQEGLRILEKLLSPSLRTTDLAPTQITVLPVRWDRFQLSVPDNIKQTLLSDLVISAGRPEMNGTPEPDCQALLSAEPSQRRAVAEAYLVARISEILMIPLNQVETHLPLTRMGFDSLMAVQIKNRITSQLGISMPIAQFIDGPSIAQLARRLVKTLGTLNQEREVTEL